MLSLIQKLQQLYSLSIQQLLSIIMRYPFDKLCLLLIQFLNMLLTR